ncbi:MAG: hypothetical protein ACK5P7_07470 [Bdellovibrio sp.]|jgi:hypothetical protein
MIRDKASHAKLAFGGFLLGRSHARGPRPFVRGRRLHVSLLAGHQPGQTSFLHQRSKKMLTAVLKRQARLHRIQFLGLRLQPREIHLEVRAKRREQLAAFLRSSAGILARKILEREKGQAKPTKKSVGLWKCRPLTAVLPQNQSWLQFGVGLKARYFNQTQGLLLLAGSSLVPLAFLSSA